MITRFLLLVVLVVCSTTCAAFHPFHVSKRVEASAIRWMKPKSSDNHDVSSSAERPPSPSRLDFLVQSSLLFTSVIPSAAVAFDGGVGGLGKTKPQTGVTYWGESVPIQNQKGIISAELNVGGDPVLVEFTAPWPLLSTTSGLEARNLQSSESAFVSILPNVSNDKQLKQAVLESILGSQGKYGAYGTPTDVKFKKLGDDNLYLISFTALTPAMRESERSVFLKVLQPIPGKDSVVLVTGTVRARFKSQQAALRNVAESFVAIAAPKSQRNVKQK